MQGGSYFLVTLLCYLLPSPTPLAENRVKVAVKRGQSQINLRFAEREQARHEIVSIGVENRPKVAGKRGQSQIYLSYAEREQARRKNWLNWC